MPAPSDNGAFHYAERICGRLPCRFLELREAAGLSKYALAKKSGVSLEMVRRIESGKSIPTLHVAARLAHGLGMTLEQWARKLEDGAP